MIKDEALKLALEALENLLNQYYADTTTRNDLDSAQAAITAIKEALAQPEQEPVAIPDCGEAGHADGACGNRECLPSFRRNTTPPQRTWVGLTEDEAFACRGHDYFETYKAIEAKLKEKNK